MSLLAKEGVYRTEQDQKNLPDFKLKFLSLHSTKLSFQGEFWIAHNLRISKLTKILRFDAEKPGEKCLKEKIGFCMPRLYLGYKESQIELEIFLKVLWI